MAAPDGFAVSNFEAGLLSKKKKAAAKANGAKNSKTMQDTLATVRATADPQKFGSSGTYLCNVRE